MLSEIVVRGFTFLAGALVEVRQMFIDEWKRRALRIASKKSRGVSLPKGKHRCSQLWLLTGTAESVNYVTNCN